MKVVTVLRSEGCVKKNVNRYDFYIIRLCSLLHIKLKNAPRDLKSGKTMRTFERNLYGVVYPELGWDNHKGKDGAQNIFNTMAFTIEKASKSLVTVYVARDFLWTSSGNCSCRPSALLHVYKYQGANIGEPSQHIRRRKNGL